MFVYSIGDAIKKDYSNKIAVAFKAVHSLVESDELSVVARHESSTYIVVPAVNPENTLAVLNLTTILPETVSAISVCATHTLFAIVSLNVTKQYCSPEHTRYLKGLSLHAQLQAYVRLDVVIVTVVMLVMVVQSTKSKCALTVVADSFVEVRSTLGLMAIRLQYALVMASTLDIVRLLHFVTVLPEIVKIQA